MPDNQSPTTDPVQNQSDMQLDAAIEQSAEATKQKAHADPAFSQSLGATPAMQDIVVDIEKELLSEITKNLDQEKMSPEEAEALAKEFLALLPIKDQQDLLDKLTKFSKENNEAQGIYLKYAKPISEEDRLKKLELMSQHIKNGQILFLSVL